ncbi:MAG TPA: TonB family protein [Candidatus Sulfotelmatobacter sp.]|nr:TonB family protein [Candidatus Sulfotelmatobacter sp.]
MALRCFVFTSDEGTAALIRQILSDLGVEAEPCSDAVVAAEKITNQNFQIVIIDWDKQPEATLLLTVARERKAAERPLTLAIVNDDKSVPGVLQAGANSVLRKPIVINQAKDTLTTARDLLRAKHDSPPSASLAAAAAASAAPSSLPPSPHDKDRTFRGGEFLVTASINPGGQFETESDHPLPSEQSSAIPADPLKDLEPMAASVATKTPEPSSPTPAPPENQSRGLEWYLKTRVATRPASPISPEPPQPRGNPELLGYDQTPSQVATPVKNTIETSVPARKPNPPALDLPKSTKKEEQRKEAELFAYMDGESAEPGSPSRFHLGKRAIVGAFVLAAIAITAAPQAPWHPQLRTLWRHGQQTMRAWLNPQPVTPVQETPAAHEDFGRPGDEYKLPVAENIPDATTDPSQIEVLPAVDPTAKKPNTDPANPAQTSSPIDPANPTQAPTGQSPDVQPSQVTPVPAQPGAAPPVPAPAVSQPPAVTTVSLPPHSSPPAPVSSAAASNPAPAAPTQPHYTSTPGNVPPSLRSQMAPASPDPSSNKPVEAALPSIEPVTVSEAAERALLINQTAIAYPANAKGQQGTVVLQVLVGRDGTVQDAKFFQGSFLFARTAIDSVKQWKFRPYILNGRPVSIQTTLTMKFKPAQ